MLTTPAVRSYLVEKGIAAERLGSQGFGESQPVDPRPNAAAWDKNRRVEFMNEAWAPEAEGGGDLGTVNGKMGGSRHGYGSGAPGDTTSGHPISTALEG